MTDFAKEKIRLSKKVRGQVVRATRRLLTVESRAFKSASSRHDKFYLARVEVDGRVFCNCTGWTIKKSGKPRQCWHTFQLIGDRPVTTSADGEFLVLAKGAK